MSRIIGTQEFLSNHAEHTLRISVLETIESIGQCAIDRTPWGLVATPLEVQEQVHVQTQSAYVYCSDCFVEVEINLSELNEED